jgi:hypothetical protein
MSRRVGRIAQVALLIGLLLVPVVLSAHVHSSTEPTSCALCLVAHASPIASVLPVVLLVVLLVTQAVGVSPTIRALQGQERRATGRAPPVAS